MLSDSSITFTKENLDRYLRELAKEYRKVNGRGTPAEIILVGGAAIIAGYGFRNMTTDIDAIIHASSAMEDAINHVGNMFNLPNGWLNSDFVTTSSYTSKLNEYSTYYSTFFDVLTIRTVGAEYLIAMKLRSGRQYKNDLSDVVGILLEHEKKGQPISKEKIKEAVQNLYGSWDVIPDVSKQFLENIDGSENLQEIFNETLKNESLSRDVLVQFAETYPNTIKESNVEEILKSLKRK